VTRVPAGILLTTAATAATVATVAMMALAGTLAAQPAAAEPAPAPSPNPADFSCALPALPHGVAGSSVNNSKLSGPAVSALRGGPARQAFALDAGGLVVKPPGRNEVPVLTADQATCAAMNSTGELSASIAQGVAVGYGQVSVAKRFFPAISGFPSPGEPASEYPMVSSFQNRLAWVVVVHTYPVAFSCPLERTPVRLVPRPSDHGYKVFMVDARTGADALIYTEGGPGGCTSGARVAPIVGAAEETVSVPWTLVSRDPGGYAGTIAATVLPCDQVPSLVLVDRSGPNVVVPVTRPFGPPCGPLETVPISLHAAVVTADLPAVIGHDPVGLTNLLSFPSSPPLTAQATTTTTPTALVPVDASSNGQTVEVTVGEVVTVQPLPGSQGSSFTSPAVSSDTAVLGPLTASPQPIVAEFRAWTVGSADITVPQSACLHPGSEQLPCRGPYVVHVVVHLRGALYGSWRTARRRSIPDPFRPTQDQGGVERLGWSLTR
jgi:hypothetical protein